MNRYLDASAAYKLLVEESESEALAVCVTEWAAGDGLVSSRLLHTELHCAAARRSMLAVENVHGVLESVTLVKVRNDDLTLAASSSWRLRTLDALHLATAIRLQVEEIITYDLEMAAAAERIGISVAAPA